MHHNLKQKYFVTERVCLHDQPVNSHVVVATRNRNCPSHQCTHFRNVPVGLTLFLSFKINYSSNRENHTGVVLQAHNGQAAR